MQNSFEDLGIAPPILQALQDMGFEAPTEVQTKAIPPILNGEDLIVMAKTGTGKTAVFGVPILQLTDAKAPGPLALILTPTRELAVQVDNDLKLMAKHLPHKTTAVYGQHNMNVEIEALQKGTTIVTGTPGRVFDHISHRALKTKNIRFLVLDEADRMLDMGFMDQVRRIIRTVPKNRTTLVFSATIPPDIQKICRDNMKHPDTIEIESPTMTVDTIQQTYYRTSDREKNETLHRILWLEQPESCMIFCNMRVTVDRVQRFLANHGYDSQALHGDIPQVKRLKTLQQFKDGKFSLLVATDVAGRGIHIDDLSLVINYDVPNEHDNYVHRIGRTGRAGNGGRAVTLVTSEDIMTLYEIEEHIGCLIEEADIPPEQFFTENRESIDKWVKAHGRKSAQPKERSPQSAKEGQRKRSRRPRQRRKNDSERQLQVVPDAKPAQLKVVTPLPPPQPVPEKAKVVPLPVQETRAAPPLRETKTKPTVQEIKTPAADNSPPQEGSVSRGLLKRMLERILGKPQDD